MANPNPNPFTPEEVAQILEAFFAAVGTRQYVGARYVPIFGRKGEDSIIWDNSAPYEPLTIVLYQGNSFTSRQYVPAGVEITNEEFWAQTGNYNAQVEQYRSEVQNVKDAVTNIEDVLPIDAFSSELSVKQYIENSIVKSQSSIESLFINSYYEGILSVAGNIACIQALDNNRCLVLTYDGTHVYYYMYEIQNTVNNRLVFNGYLDNITACNGCCIIDNTLYVVSGANMYLYDATSYDYISSVTLPIAAASIAYDAINNNVYLISKVGNNINVYSYDMENNVANIIVDSVLGENYYVNQILVNESIAKGNIVYVAVTTYQTNGIASVIVKINLNTNSYSVIHVNDTFMFPILEIEGLTIKDDYVYITYLSSDNIKVMASTTFNESQEKPNFIGNIPTLTATLHVNQDYDTSIYQIGTASNPFNDIKIAGWASMFAKSFFNILCRIQLDADYDLSIIPNICDILNLNNHTLNLTANTEIANNNDRLQILSGSINTNGHTFSAGRSCYLYMHNVDMNNGILVCGRNLTVLSNVSNADIRAYTDGSDSLIFKINGTA